MCNISSIQVYVVCHRFTFELNVCNTLLRYRSIQGDFSRIHLIRIILQNAKRKEIGKIHIYHLPCLISIHDWPAHFMALTFWISKNRRHINHCDENGRFNTKYQGWFVMCIFRTMYDVVCLCAFQTTNRNRREKIQTTDIPKKTYFLK